MGETSRNLLVGIVAGIVSGVAVSAALLVATDHYGDQLSDALAQDSCQKPGALVAETGVRASAGPGGDPAHPARDAVDGYLGSIWVPPLVSPADRASEDDNARHAPEFAPDKSGRTLVLTLPEARDVKLVCVNNALVSTRAVYQQWGKARTVETWSDSKQTPMTTTLVSMPDPQWEELQKVGSNLDDSRRIYIRLDDALTGVTVEDFDPDQCAPPVGDPRVPNQRVDLGLGEKAQLRFEQGCILAPAPRAGLSEVTIYYDPS